MESSSAYMYTAYRISATLFSPRVWTGSLYVIRFLILFPISRVLVNGKRCWRILREELQGRLAMDFVYKPLPNPRTFRLLSIEPDRWTTPLKCSLQEFSIDDDSIAFTATSYTWDRDISWTHYAGVVILPYLMEPCIEALLGSSAAKAFKVVAFNCQATLSMIASRVGFDINKERRRIILCNGKRMAIRANLYEFLLQLRQNGNEDAKYWIDAVCVDQGNIPERNSQVRLMTTVYQRAEQVFAWLGTCPSLLDSPRMMGRVHLDFKLSDLLESFNFWPIMLRPCVRLHILCCRYFQRTWIIQEFLLPRKVTFFVGQHQLSPDEIADIVRMMDYWLVRLLLGSSYDLISNLLESRKQYQAKGAFALSEYLTTVVRHQASDKRDLIFAGSGLFSPSRGVSTVPDITIRLDAIPSSSEQESLVYRPDYAASQLDVYNSCMHQLLRDEGLYALSFACSNLTASPNSQQRTFPSWFPQLYRSHALLPLRAEVGDAFSAGGKAKAAVSLIPGNHIRLDSGADQVDVVEKVLYYVASIDVIAEILDQLPATYTTTGELTITALSRTLVTDGADGRQIAATECIEGLTDFLRSQLSRTRMSRNGDQSRVHNIVETSERAAYPDRIPRHPNELIFLQANNTVDDDEFDGDTTVLDFFRHSKGTLENVNNANFFSLFCAPVSPAYERALRQRCGNRSFFITKNGYIGLGSSKLRNGDVVMVFPGAYVPFAMRPSGAITEGEEVGYRLIGEAYVHGIMYGERVSSPEWKPRPIVID